MHKDSTRTAPPFVPIVVVLALFLALSSSGVWAGAIPVDRAGLPLWEVRVYNDFPVRMEFAGIEEMQALLAKVPIAYFDREQVRFERDAAGNPRVALETRITDAEARALVETGARYEILPDVEQQVRREMERIWAEQVEEGGDRLAKGDRGVYHTEAQIGQILYQTMVDHPALADTFIIGNSVQGRPIWGIHISDNVGSEEAEPEIRLASSMHGNEPPGLEMLLYLVDFLTNEYGTDSDAAYIVNNFDLYIIPSLNPDGHVAGTRYNADGIDLNRNFPVPDGSVGDDGTLTEEAETVHIKTHGYAHHFVLSENGHSGSLVVNYPWDYQYTLAPDNAALIKMSLEYSTYNPPMYNGPFTHGITNGAAWYVVKGSLQDWAYNQNNDFSVTIEYSTTFSPPASALDSLWLDDNKQSFIHFIKSARYGVNGLVTGSDTGLPLDATVTVTGISKPVTTDPDFGDYYKLLDTGTYSITYSASGYISKTISGVSTTWATPTVLNVQLDPIAYGDVAGHVTDAGSGTGLTGTVEVRTYPGNVYVTSVQSNGSNGGAYTVHLVYGDYTFHVTATGHGSEDRVVTVDQASETQDFALPVVTEAVLFQDDFESGTGKWTGTWGLTTASYHSASNSMTDSPSGNYPANDSAVCAMANPVDLTTAESCSLSFWAKWTIELNWDCVKLQVSTDGGTIWTSVTTNYTQAASGQGKQKPTGSPVYEGTQSAWVRNFVDLSTWQTQPNVRFRFVMLSDGSTQKDGFYFDDFVIKGRQVATGVEEISPTVTRLLGNTPNPFNPSTTIRFTLAEPSAVNLSVYDIAGRLVRRLASSEPLRAGPHDFAWDGTNDEGDAVASGIYLYGLEAGAVRETRKMLLLR